MDENESLEIETIGEGNANQVTTVVFSKSTLTYVPYQIFEKFENMESLDLTGVGLERIHPNAFSRANRLKYLHLSSNNLTHLESGTFRSAHNLEFIDLASNQLEILPPGGFFAPDSQLKQFNVGFNRVNAIASDIFDDLKFLIWFRFTGNICANKDFYMLTPQWRMEAMDILNACFENYENVSPPTTTDPTKPTQEPGQSRSYRIFFEGHLELVPL